MSVPKLDNQLTFFNVGFLSQTLFKETDSYQIFKQKILPAIQAHRQALCDLYCEDNGRPGIEPVILAGVSLLQYMECAPDRKAVDHVRLHLGWKHALDLDVNYKGFHSTSLVNFRKRLLEHAKVRCIFDMILQELHKNGLIKKRGIQRIDSTHVLGCVAKMGRLEVVRETLRLFLECLQSLDLHHQVPCWDALSERYLESSIQWHKVGQPTLVKKYQQAGEDMIMLIKWSRHCPAICFDDKCLLLERVFLEQYDISGDKPTRRKNEGSGVVKNPHEPEAQWAAKDRARKKQWVGYKAQIAETVPDPDSPKKKKGEPTEQFITEASTTKAIASDYEGKRRVEEQQENHGLGAADVTYTDGGYIGAEALAKAQQEGRELHGPARPSANTSGNLFTVEDFNVSIANRTATCPAGHTSTQCSRLENKETGQADYRFEWSYHCDDCPLQTQCTKARSGRRAILVSEHHDHLQTRREEMKTEAYEQDMYKRNAIEGTISEFARNGGRRSRYRGTQKTAFFTYMNSAAINAKRWIRLLQYRMTQEVAVAT